MAIFKKLKKDIGIEEDVKKKKKDKKQEKRNIAAKKHSAPENKDNSDFLGSKGQLAVDVFQTDTDFCVQAAIAGVNQPNLDIAVENDMLVIKGERHAPAQEKEKKYLYQECYWGPFSREIILTDELKPEKIKASLKNGILLITIPKSKSLKKKITVEVD